MEDIASNLINSNNAVSVLCGTIVYFIIYLQRKNTSSMRDNEANDLKTKCELMKQRIESLENQTQILSTKLDEIVNGINSLNVNMAKLTERINIQK